MKHYLSKSKLISGWQCPKRLWLELNEPDEKIISAATQASFDVGHRVGAAAQRQFPNGILIEHDTELSKALQQTDQLLAEPGPVTLFEATFQFDGVLIRADVLIRNEAGQIRLIEVKASTSVKDYHLNDCAIQLWVLNQLGLNVVRVDLAYINNKFVYPGNGDYAGLFVYKNVTAEARTLQPTVPRLINELREVLDAGEPEVPMGAQCTRPFECPYIDYCTRAQHGPDPDWPVSWLPGGRTLHNKLREHGYRDIRDIPAGTLSHRHAEWARRLTVAGTPELRPAAAEELRQLGWPRYYFDFETMAPAVPLFAGTRPYETQAFQWSCHIEQADGRLEHCEFLANSGKGGATDGGAGSVAGGGFIGEADGRAVNEASGRAGRTDANLQPPMRPCAEALITALGDTGPIFMYTGYERSVINRLKELCPDLAAPLEGITERLYDLHPVTRANYYHPDMHGSWSIKKVLPTVAPDLSYEGLEIVSVGTDAEVAFVEMIDAATAEDRAEELRAALLRYCKLDTEAMVRLAKFLEGRADLNQGVEPI